MPASASSGPAPYPFNIGCIADLGQTFNSSTTLARLLVRTHHDWVMVTFTFRVRV